MRNRERILGILAEEFNVPEDRATDGANFIDLGMDSLDAVELVMALETEFDADIPDEKIEMWRTLGDVFAHFPEATP